MPIPAHASERQRTSANAGGSSQRTSANVRERPRTSANVRERPRTSANAPANVRERPRMLFEGFYIFIRSAGADAICYVPGKFLPTGGTRGRDEANVLQSRRYQPHFTQVDMCLACCPRLRAQGAETRRTFCKAGDISRTSSFSVLFVPDSR